MTPTIILAIALALASSAVHAQQASQPETAASQFHGTWSDWFKAGSLDRIGKQVGPKSEPVWTPYVFGTPCSTTSICGPGVGPPPSVGPTQPPRPSPCSETATCGPGVGSVGGVILKKDLDLAEKFLHAITVPDSTSGVSTKAATTPRQK